MVDALVVAADGRHDFMARSSHLGQVLFRGIMSPSALFINLDDAHESDGEI